MSKKLKNNYLIKKAKKGKKAIYQVNWRWSRILGYHVPDTHDAI